MNEKLLQFIWRYQYFQLTDLESTHGERISILRPGTFNTDQGPDFLEAKIKLENTILVGHIELHVKSSDWDLHQHSKDAQYDNVVLHVVWSHNSDVKSVHPFATLELQNYVPKILLERYDYLLQRPTKFIACQDYLPVLSELSWTNWKERLGVERLKRKSLAILDNLVYYKGDWASVFWEELAAGFGIKNNSESFRHMARSIPINIIRRQRENILVLECLFFGQVGLLQKDLEDAYPQQLKKEYLYQKRKHVLPDTAISLAFLRMHPRNFPTIRLAQLAKLLHVSAHLLVKILETDSLSYVENLFDVCANEYWDTHYVFDKASPQQSPKKLGDSMIQVLMINCVIPTVFAYGSFLQDEKMQEKALSWLSQMHSESNNVIDQWKTYGIASANALESQSLLELNKQYCQQLKCLSCNVGIGYLKQA